MSRKLNIMLALNMMGLGGSQTYVLTLATELKRRGHNVIVASIGGQLVEDLTCQGIKHYSVSMPWHGTASPDPVRHHKRYVIPVLASQIRRRPDVAFRPAIALAQVANIVRKEKIDIVHSSQPGPTLVAYLASLVTNVPFVTTVHGTLRNEFPPIGFGLARKRLGKIIAISDEVKEHLTGNYAIKEDSISVIYNGIDLRKYSPQAGGEVQVDGDTVISPRRVLHASGFAGAVQSIVEVVPLIAQAIPDIEMSIIRPGTESGEAGVLAREINRQLGREAVKLIGPTTDLLGAINSSEVVIGIGRCALEAMACGKPVVVAGNRKGPFGGSFGGVVSLENIAEIKKYNFTGRNSTEVATADKIAEAIVRLLENDEYRREAGEVGRRIVEEELNSQKFAEQIEKVYLEVLEER